MSSFNKVALAKLCKQHYTINHIRRCLLSRCLSSVFTKISARKAKQSIAFGLLLLAGIFTTSVSAQTVVNICDRTAVVESAILAAIPSPPACTAVTTTQLAAITSLDLSNMSITALQSGDFANLTGLTTLHLQGNTFTTPLPANLFDDLPSAAVIEIDLAPIGDLADMALTLGGTTTINIANAFISKDATGTDRDLSFSTTLSGTSATATVNEGVLTITASSTITGDTDVRVTANDGTNTVIRTISVMVMDICSRTAQVQAAILAAIPAISDCMDVTATHLAAITGTLNLISTGITTLQSGDFAGLTSLTTLFLNSNALTTIEANTFSGLTSLTSLSLSRNALTTIEANTFSGLTSLTSLSLSRNALTTIEANTFSGLTSLTSLSLSRNALTTIEANTFSGLTSLTSLDLGFNDLTTIEADTFSDLTSLTFLGLRNNDLTTIEADTFSGLTSLTTLVLNSNALTTIEANTFSALTTLTTLNLEFNALLTTIEAGAFSGLTSLTSLDLGFNDLTTIEADTFSDLTSLITLELGGNDLTTIEANAFSDLTSLITLELGGNDLTTIEANAFSDLTSLTTLYLGGNPFTTPLPVDIFDPLPDGALIEIDLSPIGDLDEVALTVSGTTTINVRNAFISRNSFGRDRTLSYTATPANTAVATATESSGVVTITGAGMGTTTVSVTADDGNRVGRSMYTRNIAVTVTEAGILAFDEATGNTAATVVAAENNGTDMVYVQLASAPTSDVTMTVMSSATAEGTVTPSELTFTTMNWNTRQALTVTAIPDQIDRDDTFTVDFAITSGDGGDYPDTLTLSSVQVTITDDDTAGIDGYDMATGGNPLTAITTAEAGTTTDTFHVALTSQPTGTVSVTVTSGDPSEGTITTGASLTFTAMNWETRQAVTVTAVDDNDVDGDETYDVTLTPTGGGYDGVTAETVSITNTDDDTAALSIADMTVSENAGTATLTVTLTPAVTAGDVMVDLMTTDGTATAGADYTAITSQTLTFAAGSTTQTLDITISDDSIAENDETFTVTLDNLMLPAAVTGDVSITDDTAIVTITDDDITPTGITLSVSQPTIADTADATEITVTATLDGTAVLPTDTVVTVSVGDVSDSATEGTDYVTVPNFTLTIPALSSSAMGTFTIDPDTSSTNGETITIDGTSGTFTFTATTLTIVKAGISVFESQTSTTQISTATIAEASSDTFYVELASEPTGNVTLSVTSDDANEGTVSPGTLTFTTMNWNTRQVLIITAVDDNIDRENDTFMVGFEIATAADGDGANYTSSLTLPSVSVTVTDNDVASDTIALDVSTNSVTETAGETFITVTATLNGAASVTDTAVEVIVSGGTASPNIDYTLAIISSGDITIPTGTITLPTSALTTITIPQEMTSGSGTFAITPIADNENDNEETITISGAASINSNPVTVNTAILTITGFSEEEQQVIEQTVAAQASSVTQVVSENIGSFLASRTSAPPSAPSAPAPPAPDGGGGGDVNRESFTSIDWQDWQGRFAKLAYEGLKRLDNGADMSLDWALKAAGGDGRLLMPLGVESLTLWAAGGRLKTKGDGMGNYDGGVNSFVVGVDTNLINNWLLGIAASYSDSQVDYTMDGNPIGTTEQNLYSVHPFLSHSLPEHGLTLWVTGGYGVGDIDFSHTTNGEASSDVTQWMAAGGIEKHIITNTSWQGALRLKGLWGNATVDATEYDNGVDIRKVESTFWRARMESEMGYNFALPGANVRPYALIGGRWDHNDAIVSGDEWHIDIGGGVEVLSGNAFALNISVHTQVTDGDTEEDSIIGTGSLTYDIGHDRQGLQITLSRPLNNTSPSWDQHSFNEVTDKVSGVNSAPLTSELAYGWTVHPFALEGALQTYVQNSFGSHERHYAVGLELVINALTLNFETGYGEADNTGLESMFKTKIRW